MREPSADEPDAPADGAGGLRYNAGCTRRPARRATLLQMLRLDPAPASERRDLLGLILLFGLLYSFQLGQAPLANPDEGRYAEIPREMLAGGDFILPRLNGVYYFEKPPLMYWMVAGCQRLFGASELAQRATPALFALAGVLLAYLAARRLHGRLAGLCAAVVLGSSLLYFALARILVLDMAVSVLMSVTLFCFLLGVREPPGRRRRLLLYGLYAGAALATLTKGLIGLLVPGAVMLLWLLVCGEWRRLRPLHLPSGAALFLAIAAPWHLLAAGRNADWAQFYFVHEHWERFTTTAHGRFEPWWYFVPVLLGGLFPWPGFLWPALRDALAGGWARRKENSEAWFLVLWAAFVFLFFSASQSKLAPYILPALPPLALLLGRFLAQAIATDARARLRTGTWIFSALAVGLGLAFAAVVLRPALLLDATRAEALRGNAIFGALALAAGALTAPWLNRLRSGWVQRGAFGTLVAIAVTSLALLLALAGMQAGIARAGTRGLAAVFVERARPGDRVFHYAEYFHDFSYYARREVGLVGNPGELEVAIDPGARASGRFLDQETFLRQWAGPERIWVVARKATAKKLFSDPSVRYYLQDEGPSHVLFSNQP